MRGKLRPYQTIQLLQYIIRIYEQIKIPPVQSEWDERMYIDMKNTPNSKGKIPERTRVIKGIKKSFQANTTKHKLPSTDKINQPPKK